MKEKKEQKEKHYKEKSNKNTANQYNEDKEKKKDQNKKEAIKSKKSRCTRDNKNRKKTTKMKIVDKEKRELTHTYTHTHCSLLFLSFYICIYHKAIITRAYRLREKMLVKLVYNDRTGERRVDVLVSSRSVDRKTQLMYKESI